MKKTLATMFLLSVCSLGVAVAQSPDQPQADQQNSPSSRMGKNITITGCLQPGTDPNSFVLYNVTPSDNSQGSQQQSYNQRSESRTYNDQGKARSETRTESNQSRNQDRAADDESLQGQSQSEPSEMARTETSYTLIPEGRVDLKSHVGQRVEVTGKISESTSRTEQSSKATTPAGQSSTMHSATEMSGQPQFRVSSIRQLSQSCQ